MNHRNFTVAGKAESRGGTNASPLRVVPNGFTHDSLTGTG